MHYASLSELINAHLSSPMKGPVALIMVEDDVEVASTIRHHQKAGFAQIIVLMPIYFNLSEDLQNDVLRVDYNMSQKGATEAAVNRLMDHLDGVWVFYCYNAEYFFYPFCETRSVAEMIAFQEEERRDAMLTYVVDLYADDLATHADAVSLENAFMDRSGYYALARADATRDGHHKERQLDFFGGLRWRYEEHVPKHRRKIDRISLFRARKGLRMRSDHTFDDEEYNTYACPWHHNITAALCSFRTAKALKLNPGSTYNIETFKWHNSTKFRWESRQLLDLGLMEPGQWF